MGFNWGRALSSGGGSLQNYFGQKMAEEQRAKQLAEQRDYEYNDWLRRNQMQGQQADERWQRQFDATHTTLPFQGGSMVAPVEMAVPNSSLFNLMTRKAEQPSQPVSYGEPYSVDLGNGKVAWFKDPSDGGKPVKLGESQPKGGGGEGGAGGVKQPTAAQAHGMFVDAWGEPDTYRRSKWDENDNLIVQEVPIPPVGTRFPVQAWRLPTRCIASAELPHKRPLTDLLTYTSQGLSGPARKARTLTACTAPLRNLTSPTRTVTEHGSAVAGRHPCGRLAAAAGRCQTNSLLTGLEKTKQNLASQRRRSLTSLRAGSV